MVSVGIERPRSRVSLVSLLADRDASLEVRPNARARLAARVRAARRESGKALSNGWRLVAALLTFMFAAVIRHGLVLAGLSAWTWAAWTFSLYAGLVVLGASLFFLEARRR